eukprot:494308_1
MNRKQRTKNQKYLHKWMCDVAGMIFIAFKEQQCNLQQDYRFKLFISSMGQLGVDQLIRDAFQSYPNNPPHIRHNPITQWKRIKCPFDPHQLKEIQTFVHEILNIAEVDNCASSISPFKTISNVSPSIEPSRKRLLVNGDTISNDSDTTEPPTKRKRVVMFTWLAGNNQGKLDVTFADDGDSTHVNYQP